MNVGDRASRSVARRGRRHRAIHGDDGDRNPLHYDAEVAAASRFGGIIVQGGVTTGLLNVVVAENLPGPGSVFMNVNWDFRAPTRPGDVITASAEIISVHVSKPICTMRTTITNQHGDTVVEGTAVVYREPLTR